MKPDSLNSKFEEPFLLNFSIIYVSKYYILKFHSFNKKTKQIKITMDILRWNRFLVILLNKKT